MSTTAAAPAPAPITNEQVDSGANSIIRKYMLWSMGAGLVPVPWVDMAAIAGVQLKMITEIAEKYGQKDEAVKFADSKGKAIVGTLVGSVVPGQMASGALGGLVKMVPFVGMVTIPAFAAASTYALGKVFAQHFASGGTFLNFNPDSVRTHFKKHFAEAEAGAKA
jgi:uncharacterized protein (DUF697 family)